MQPGFPGQAVDGYAWRNSKYQLLLRAGEGVVKPRQVLWLTKGAR
jgi:hypothetical protein